MKKFSKRPRRASVRPHAVRQVLLLEDNWETSQLDTMEDIRVSIVNDRLTGTKRQREESVAASPCSKRHCRTVFSCSTPCSASFRFQHSASTSQSGGAMQNQGVSPISSEINDEWDDSLLEPSDYERDSPLHMTIEQIEELLEDDSCYAAEPHSWNNEEDMSEIKEASIQSAKSPCKETTESALLVDEKECDLETTLYDAMAPPCCQSSVCTETLDKIPAQVDSTVLTLRTPSLGSEQNSSLNGGSRVSPTILPTIPSAGTELASLCHNTAELPQHLNLLLSDLETGDQWSEGSDLPFDCDIDQLLMLSPGDTASVEESSSEAASTHVIVPADSPDHTLLSEDTLCLKESHSEEAATCVQADSPNPILSSSVSCPKTSSTSPLHNMSCSVLTPKSSETTEHLLPSSVTSHKPENVSWCPSKEGLEMDYSKPTDVKDTEGDKVRGSSMTLPDEPVSKTTTQKFNELQEPQVKAATKSKKPISSVPSQVKKRGMDNPLPSTAYRLLVSSHDLEGNKNRYCDQVMMHLDAHNISEDPHYELAFLLNQISRDNPNWQHPSDLTRRNHPRCSTKLSTQCSLNQWVERNGGDKQRFKGLPSTFQRSPIPEFHTPAQL